MPPLPRASLGLGLRPPMIGAVLEARPESIDYFEIISDNYLHAAPIPARKLAAVRAHYPVVLHGVGLNLLGHAPLDEDYLSQLVRLADELDAPLVSDHLCWTAAHGVAHHDLLPVPYVPELVELAAQRARYVQQRLQRPFALENLSSYVQFTDSTMSEWEFVQAILDQSGCQQLLDLNNIYVSSQNHGFDPLDYLASVDFSRVAQVHLAGHTQEPSGLRIDTHDQPVCDEVWALYAQAWQRGGPFPTLLEWDSQLPPLPVLLAELERARQVRGG